MKTMLKKFWLEEDGGESVEWPLWIGLLAVGIVALLTAMNKSIQTILGNLGTALATAAG